MHYFRPKITNYLLVVRKIVYVSAILWTAIIAVLCLAKFGKLPSFGVSGIDKYVHFTFHFVFTLLWGYFSWLKQPEMELKLIVKIVLISLFYGIVIELLQETCTTTRHADVFDVVANLSGAATAFVCFIFLKKRIGKPNYTNQ